MPVFMASSHICLQTRVEFHSKTTDLCCTGCSRPLQRTAEEEVQDSLFSQAYIPKHLDDVDDHEADFQRLAAGGAAAEGIYYQAYPLPRLNGPTVALYCTSVPRLQANKNVFVQ